MSYTHIATMLIAALTVTVVAEAEAQSIVAEVARGGRAATSATRTDTPAFSALRWIDRQSNLIDAADPAASQQTPSGPPALRDSVLNGVLIGVGVGALLGLIPDHYDDCEECHNSIRVDRGRCRHRSDSRSPASHEAGGTFGSHG